MRYHVLATDYDGTLATRGRVDERTADALRRLKASGRRLVLVSGRPLEDLLKLFTDIEVCDMVLAENGALLYDPARKQESTLGPPVPKELVEEMKRRGLPDFHVGRAIINAWEPYQKEIFEIIHDLGLEWNMIFNKGNVMVLPSGVSKGSGIRRVLADLGYSRHNTVAIGDAENDHHFMRICEVSVAVANALPSVKEQADLVMQGAESEGVVELIEALLDNDLQALDPPLPRHDLILGQKPGGEDFRVKPYGNTIIVSGEPMSGKTTLTRRFLEQLSDHEYQFCLFDPEGDYEESPLAVSLGSEQQAPSVTSVINVLERTDENVTISLLSVPYPDRPQFFQKFYPALNELRQRTGRPHWIVMDESHHMLPREWAEIAKAVPDDLHEYLMVTTALKEMAPQVLEAATLHLVTGNITPEVSEFLPGDPQELKEIQDDHPKGDFVALWNRPDAEPQLFHAYPPSGENLRHKRKYARAELPPDVSFIFTGPEERLHLEARNLIRFMELADGVDDQTWTYHLSNGDITKWFKNVIKDPELVSAGHQAADDGLDPDESRELIRSAIEERYTGLG